MNGSLSTGYSGLINTQKALDVESNNISNVNTTSYKSDVVSFADMMCRQGTNIMGIDKDFKDGGFKTTGNSYDFAIQGDGFFSASDGVTEFYTRAGNLRRGGTGYLENGQQLKIQGLIPSNPSPATIEKKHITHILTSHYENEKEVSSLNIFSIDYKKEMKDDPNYNVAGYEGTGLKSKDAKIADINSLIAALKVADSQFNNNPIDGIVPTNAQYTLDIGSNEITESINININNVAYQQAFDTDTKTTLKKLADQVNQIEGVKASFEDPSKLKIESLVKGSEVDMNSILIDPSSTKIKIGIPSPENYNIGSGKALYTALLEDIKSTIKSVNGKDDDVVVSISTISKITTDTVMDAPAFSDILLTLDQANGTRPAIREYVTHGTITRSGLGELEFDNNNIYMNDGDGKYLVGRLVPVVFTNNNGLEPMGDNVYRKTVNSGDAMVTKNTLEVKNGMLEMSNSDLAESLVNLMVFQRAYEANSKALSTSDEFLKTAINLKK